MEKNQVLVLHETKHSSAYKILPSTVTLSDPDRISVFRLFQKFKLDSEKKTNTFGPLSYSPKLKT